VQRFGQPLGDVAGLVDLAALDGRVPAEGVADRLGQRPRAVDDEQAADGRLEAAADHVVEQRLADGGVLRRPLDHAQGMLVAVAVDTHGGQQDQVILDVDAIDLDDQQVHLGQVGGHPLLHALRRQGHEPPRHRRLGDARSHGRRNVAAR